MCEILLHADLRYNACSKSKSHMFVYTLYVMAIKQTLKRISLVSLSLPSFLRTRQLYVMRFKARLLKTKRNKFFVREYKRLLESKTKCD